MPPERIFRPAPELDIPPKDIPTWLRPDLFDESKKNEAVFRIRSLDRYKIYTAIKYVLFGLSQETDGWGIGKNFTNIFRSSKDKRQDTKRRLCSGSFSKRT